MIAPITVVVYNDTQLISTIAVPYRVLTAAQTILEEAYNIVKRAGTQPAFNFALQYYGTDAPDVQYLGYMVIMINNIYDQTSSPYSYWHFQINGVDASEGIDEYVVQPGDKLGFVYKPYTPSTTDSPALKAKHALNTAK